METIAVDEKKLEELVEKVVQKHLDLTFQDMEKVRQSPGAAIIRIENRLDSIEARLERDMVTRAEFIQELGSARTESKQETASLRAELKQETASLRTELKQETASLRTELKQETASLRTELKEEIATLRTELKEEIATLRTELKQEIAGLRVELKDEIWKLRLYIILLAILIVLTNPKVLELLGKLLSIFKP